MSKALFLLGAALCMIAGVTTLFLGLLATSEAWHGPMRLLAFVLLFSGVMLFGLARAPVPYGKR